MKLIPSFELIVPVLFSPDIRESPVLDVAFSRKTISRTPRLEGRPLLDEQVTPLFGCYELRQNLRGALGLHGNEGHRYTLAKEDIDFQIRKVKLWLFQCGIGFVSLHVDAAELESCRILNLVSELSTIRLSRKIKYSKSLDRDTWTEQVFTLREMLKKLFHLLGMDALRPLDGETYQKAHCLFYGMGTVEDEQTAILFLEMLRNRKKYTCMTSEYEPAYYYRPYPYITWAVSAHVLAAVGNLNTTEENRHFLTDGSGLSYSVFADYMLIYLNLIAAALKLTRLSAEHRLFDAVAIASCPPDVLNSMQELINTPLYGAANEPHINILFDQYLAYKSLELPQKLGPFSAAITKRLLQDPTALSRQEDDALIADILRACEKIQTNISYRDVHEDVRNRGIRDILDQKNARYTVHDQSQQGESGRGHGSGEVDILFKRSDRSQWTIFEGLNILRGFSDRRKWEEHLSKLLYRYDKKGNNFLILAAYTECSVNTWGMVWDKYFSHMSTYCPECEVQPDHAAEIMRFHVVQNSCTDFAPVGYVLGSNMRIARCTYEIGEQRTDVIHVFVRFDSTRCAE